MLPIKDKFYFSEEGQNVIYVDIFKLVSRIAGIEKTFSKKS